MKLFLSNKMESIVYLHFLGRDLSFMNCNKFARNNMQFNKIVNIKTHLNHNLIQNQSCECYLSTMYTLHSESLYVILSA